MSYNVLIPSSSSSIIITILIAVYLLIPIAFSINDNELDYRCLPSNKPFTSLYNESRALVVMDLIFSTPLLGGFRNASCSRDINSDEWAHGLALCRADVSREDCQGCVENAATTVINTYCPNSRSAIIWRDYCMVKYSDVDFLGKIDAADYNITMWNRFDSYWASNDVDAFLEKLIQLAIKKPMMFANESMEEMDLGSLTHLYGLVQCSRDLVPNDCNTCLNLAVEGLRKCCDTKQGARVVYGSCNVRFETYNFLKS